MLGKKEALHVRELSSLTTEASLRASGMERRSPAAVNPIAESEQPARTSPAYRSVYTHLKDPETITEGAH
ncbi:unnamed protein product [Spodoptera exigua]|nr:unnamed protein product [Spodoptera exigua]